MIVIKNKINMFSTDSHSKTPSLCKYKHSLYFCSDTYTYPKKLKRGYYKRRRGERTTTPKRATASFFSGSTGYDLQI